MPRPAGRSTIHAVTWRGRWNRAAAGLVPLVVGIVVLAGCSSGSSDSGGSEGASAPPAAPATVAPHPAPWVRRWGAGLVRPPVAGGRAPPPAPTGGVRPGADWPTYHGDA